MTIDQIKKAAATHGFTITPFSATVKDTVRRVKGGAGTAARLSDATGVSGTAARNRLVAAARLGLLRMKLLDHVSYYYLADGVSAFRWVQDKSERNRR